MRRPTTFLGHCSEDEFLSAHWQKRPLLCRGALPDYQSPVTAESLQALASSYEVESRLVVHENSTWRLEPGPFEADLWPSLPERDWTLLVQDLEYHTPEAGALLSLLDFLPGFRIDDLMASYAVPGGSVGPHFDHYDVFLLQVAGRRRWQLSSHFDRTRLRDDTALCVLSDFDAEEEWILEPGDMLYLPPGVAHFGVALDPCITFSLGCRAPSAGDLVAQLATNIATELGDEVRYSDPDLALNERGSELGASAVARAAALLAKHFVLDDSRVARAFGQLVTLPKALFADPDDAAELPDPGGAQGYLRAGGSRWLHHSHGPGCTLFVNGLAFAAPAAAKACVRLLCEERSHSAERIAGWLQEPDCAALLNTLLEHGLLQGTAQP